MSSYQKRRISEQTYKFPKCIFPFFSQYTIYIYFVYDVVQLELSALRCCWSINFFLLHENVMCSVCLKGRGRFEWGMGEKKREREAKKENEKGPIGKS